MKTSINLISGIAIAFTFFASHIAFADAGYSSKPRKNHVARRAFTHTSSCSNKKEHVIVSSNCPFKVIAPTTYSNSWIDREARKNSESGKYEMHVVCENTRLEGSGTDTYSTREYDILNGPNCTFNNFNVEKEPSQMQTIRLAEP